MVLLRAQSLLEKAHAGEILSAKDRRHCIDYILTNSSANGKHLNPITVAEMADLFKVSERQIRDDKRKVREQRAKEISEEDVSLVIVELLQTFDDQIADAHRQKRKVKPGTPTYLQYIKAITELTTQKITILQSLGYYPKNLGNLNVETFDYTAIVDPMTNKTIVGKTKDVVVDTVAEVVQEVIAG